MDEHPERLCSYSELEDIEMKAEAIKECLKCKDETCPIKTITLAQSKSIDNPDDSDISKYYCPECGTELIEGYCEICKEYRATAKAIGKKSYHPKPDDIKGTEQHVLELMAKDEKLREAIIPKETEEKLTVPAWACKCGTIQVDYICQNCGAECPKDCNTCEHYNLMHDDEYCFENCNCHHIAWTPKKTDIEKTCDNCEINAQHEPFCCQGCDQETFSNWKPKGWKPGTKGE